MVPDIDVTQILFSLLLIMLQFLVFVITIIYFFTEVRINTCDTRRKVFYVSGFITFSSLLSAVLARYFISFPKSGIIDMNSDYTFVINVLSALYAFFMYILYLRTGEHFTREKQLPGSLYLKGIFQLKKLDLRYILIPVLLIAFWSVFVFIVTSPEASDIAISSYPQEMDLPAVIYIITLTVLAAPLKEEILFRHFGMGLLYKWWGTGKLALFFSLLITSSLFALSHMFILTEDWIKIAQVLPMGFILGYVYHKKGLEHSVLVHALFNILAWVLPI